jgi:hypothetical protein
MSSVPSVVQDLILGSRCLHFGLYHRLLNLSQVARLVQPVVEARVRKRVRASAIVVSLSRLQKTLQPSSTDKGLVFYVDRLNIHTGLCTATVVKTPEARTSLDTFYTQVRRAGSYLTLTEGHTEVTVIFESRHRPRLLEALGAKPKQVQENVAGLGVMFRAEYMDEPGLLYQLLQQLSFLNINVVEVASTMTEFNIYLREEDLVPAFDAIYQRFSRTDEEKAGGV